MSYYRQGLALNVNVVPSKIKQMYDRARNIRVGAREFRVGSQHFYDQDMIIGGSIKDGIVGFLLDVTHILLLIGGVFLVMKAINI